MSIVLTPTTKESNSIAAAAPFNRKEPSGSLSSSPADGSGKKRTRATTRALLKVDDNGSPEKAEKATETSQPSRKVSKLSIAFGSKEHP